MLAHPQGGGQVPGGLEEWVQTLIRVADIKEKERMSFHSSRSILSFDFASIVSFLFRLIVTPQEWGCLSLFLHVPLLEMVCGLSWISFSSWLV